MKNGDSPRRRTYQDVSSRAEQVSASAGEGAQPASLLGESGCFLTTERVALHSRLRVSLEELGLAWRPVLKVCARFMCGSRTPGTIPREIG